MTSIDYQEKMNLRILLDDHTVTFSADKCGTEEEHSCSFELDSRQRAGLIRAYSKWNGQKLTDVDDEIIIYDGNEMEIMLYEDHIKCSAYRGDTDETYEWTLYLEPEERSKMSQAFSKWHYSEAFLQRQRRAFDFESCAFLLAGSTLLLLMLAMVLFH